MFDFNLEYRVKKSNPADNSSKQSDYKTQKINSDKIIFLIF